MEGSSLPTDLDIEAAHCASIVGVCESSGISLKQRGSDWWALCPFHKEKTPSFKVSPDRGLYYCFGCGEGGDVIKLAQLLGGLGFRDTVEELCGTGSTPVSIRMPDHAEHAEKAERNSAFAREIWGRRLLLQGSLAESYLRARGLVPPYPPTLAFLPFLYHTESKERWPCLLAAVAVAGSRKVVAVHRPFLARDGSGKAPEKPQKKMLGPVSGGAVRLAGAGPQLAIAEGFRRQVSQCSRPLGYQRGRHCRLVVSRISNCRRFPWLPKC